MGTTWKCLLIVYAQIDVRIPRRFFGSQHFRHELSEQEIRDAVASFRRFPNLVAELSEQKAGIEFEIVESNRILSSLSTWQKGFWWPSPNDTQIELDQYVSAGDYHSVFVLWPQKNLQTEDSVKSGAWGLGMSASDWSLGTTYATVANAPSSVWNIPARGEVWLHEWLHGVCAHFRRHGYTMPTGDADAGGRCGYEQSPLTGWTDFYRCLMCGRVMEDGIATGIPPAAWHRHPPA